MCIHGLRVGTRQRSFSLVIGASGDAIYDVTRWDDLPLPCESEPFFVRKIAEGVLVIDLDDDLRIVFYASGYVRVEANPSSYFEKVRNPITITTIK